MYRIDFERIDWVSPMPGVRHKVSGDGKKRVRLVEYTREMEPHWCSKGHLGYILEGRFEIEFDDRKEVFENGDGVFIPDGEEHRHRARVLSPSVTAIFVEDE
jgi:mannose-6-phosphate isomerase-like protein (cupin superfamily)